MVSIQNEFIQKILNDKRMNQLFRGKEAVCFQGWVLELEDSNGKSYQWLYGRVLSSDYQNNRWTSDLSKHNKPISIENIKVKVISLQLFTSSEKLAIFIKELLQEQSFSDISAKIEVTTDKKLESVFNLLKFPFPCSIRPVIHLPPRENYVWDTTKVSPNSEASYDSAAISLLNKTNVWNNLNISISKQLLTMISEKLANENIDIAGIDSWRLGDLEFLSSPSINNQEKKKFDLEVKKKNILNIYEKLSDKTLLAILKIFSGDSLLSTSIKEFKISEYPYSLEFEIDNYSNEIFNAYTLEIFEKDASSSTLLVQEGHPLVRTINFQSNAISNISNPENDPWLEKGLPKSSLHKAKIFTSIERLNYHRSEFSVNNAYKDPWFDANIDIKNYLETVLPTASNSHFFPKLSFDGESRLELVDWLRKVLKKYPNAQVAWFDPFMEDVGINLLNRLGFSAGNYIVFTSQTEEEQDRINHLVKQCENWAETIGSVRLKVFGPEKLHDRMILIRENDGKPLAGYHLSNSIQRANENHPLLVTEIPLDVLYPIFSYVDKLIQDQEVSNKIAIFDSTAYQPKSRDERKLFDTQLPYQFSKLGWVLAQWWQQPELENLSGEVLKKYLLNVELGFNNYREKYTDIPSIFFNDPFSSRNFIEEWNAFGTLLAHIPADKYCYEIETGKISSTLVDKLITYLNPSRENALEQRNKNTVLDLKRYLEISFERLVCYEHPERVFQYEPSEISYADYFAIKILWCLSSDKLIGWLEEQLMQFSHKNHRQRALITDALRCICMDFDCLDKWTALFKSKHCFLQWIGLVKIRSLFFEKKIDENKVCQIIYEHPTIDKSKIFLWFIRESVFKQDKFHTLFLSRTIELLGKHSINKERLKEFLNLLRGRLGKLYHQDCWVLDSVLEPMIQNKLISYYQIMDIWLQDLEDDWNKAIKDKNKHIYFGEITEGKFSDEIVYLFLQLSEEEQRIILGRFEKIINLAVRVIRKPLSRSINYSLYINSFKVSIWMLAIFNRILKREVSELIYAKLVEFQELLLNVHSRYKLIDYGSSNEKDLLKYYNES